MVNSIKKIFMNKNVRIALITFGVILVFFLGVGAYAYFTAKSFLPTLNSLQKTGSELSASFQGQDLGQAKIKAIELAKEVDSLDNQYGKVMWASSIPFIGSYAKDGKAGITAAKSLVKSLDTLITSVEPYADLLGFKTSSASASGDKKNSLPQSIEDKIVFMAQTLDKISPDLDKVAADMELAQKELDKIDPARYPEQLMGKNIRSNIVSLKSTVSDSAQLLTQAKPLIKLLPDLLGNPNPKQYMLLFQNDAEIRPTGGFLTAYAFLKVTKGKIEPQGSYDIYDLDARFNKKVAAPAPIQKYLNEKYLNLRNVNIYPDFKVSMDEFSKYYRELSGPRPDGIVAIDTKLPVEILKIIGPIGVGGWGNFSAQNDPRCNCPQVVYALEEIADRPTNTVRVGRKAVLGPLMHSMLANAMGSPKHLWPKLMNVALDAIKQKHLIFYFYDPKTQLIAEDFNAAGRIRDYSYDYLHVNDANLGGAKSDMFIIRDVEQEIESVNGKVTKTVTLNYNNPVKGSNCNLEAGQLCLNGTYRDYVRLMVPKGSTLISVVGSEVKETVTEESGKTVFEAFFTMRPQSQSKIVFKYELPQLDLSTYKLLIQKQPGLPTIKYTTIYNGSQILTDLDGDKELTLN